MVVTIDANTKIAPLKNPQKPYCHEPKIVFFSFGDV